VLPSKGTAEPFGLETKHGTGTFSWFDTLACKPKINYTQWFDTGVRSCQSIKLPVNPGVPWLSYSAGKPPALRTPAARTPLSNLAMVHPQLALLQRVPA
jgi:hypothetical protein